MFLADKLNKGGSLGGYQISRSLRFNSADGTSLDRTPSSATNRQTFTISFWAKNPSTSGAITTFYAAGSNTNVDETIIGYWDGLYVQNTLSSASWRIRTNAVYRDPSAWYHYIFAFDLSNGTQANRLKIYVNGVESAYSAADGNPLPSTANSQINNNVIQYIGRRAYSSTGQTTNAYMTEFYLIDGQALTPSSFGETNAQTGVWQPKAYSGSYGTNGFYLNFSDNSNTTAATLGKDYSGNGNNWTPNNFSVTAGIGNDSLVDSPTSYGVDTGVGGNVRGNYATMNPLAKASQMTVSNGNLECIADGSWRSVLSTFGMTTGKWYWEQSIVSGVNMFSGIAKGNMDLSTFIGYADANGWGYYNSNGYKWNNGSGSAYGASVAAGDIVGIAFDADAGTIVFYKNGTSQGTAFSGLTSGPYFPAASSETQTVSINFGQRPFAYTAPSGYKALCTQNLPTPTIGATTATQAGKYFNPVLYTGNGGTQSVTGVGFQPDFVWIKRRDTNQGHGLEDAIRSAGRTLDSSSAAAEVDYSAYFTAFTSDGFNMALGGGIFNANAGTYVAWNWNAGGSNTTNTSGSITSTVRANTTSGFSVVTFTTQASGTATVGHGLGVAPAFIITKLRAASNNWNSYHVSLGNSASINLNQSDAVFTGSTNWNSTSPTSSVFSLGSNWAGSYSVVAYCFAEIAGYSKFGIYTGNGSADGPFVFTGMRPSYIMVKCSNSTYNWIVFDNKRSGFNVNNDQLYPNTSGGEDAGGSGAQFIDLLSNGFKLRNTAADKNAIGGTYIFMAFAEAPLKFSLAR